MAMQEVATAEFFIQRIDQRLLLQVGETSWKTGRECSLLHSGRDPAEEQPGFRRRKKRDPEFCMAAASHFLN